MCSAVFIGSCEVRNFLSQIPRCAVLDGKPQVFWRRRISIGRKLDSRGGVGSAWRCDDRRDGTDARWLASRNQDIVTEAQGDSNEVHGQEGGNVRWIQTWRFLKKVGDCALAARAA